MSVANRLIARSRERDPDFVIGGSDRPYLLRWWLTPWRRWSEDAKGSRSRVVRLGGRLLGLLPNVYLHQFLRSDDDRALHDHPWLFNFSWLLAGCYREHTSSGVAVLVAGDWKFRWGAAPHRVELFDHIGSGSAAVWTLFVTGPNVREWGFYCPDRWVHWKAFTSPVDKGAVGRGCD